MTDGDGEDSDPLLREDPWLAGVLAASVTGRIATGPQAGRRVSRAGDRVDPEEIEAMSSERCVRFQGFSLHANVAVPDRDRQRLERLIRYMARGPIATERLERLPDGRVVYAFKHPWRDGTSQVVLSPLELLEKLVPRNYVWAELMRRVWEFDVLVCECGGRLRIVSAIHPPETTRKILGAMGLPSRAPPLAPARLEPRLDSTWI